MSTSMVSPSITLVTIIWVSGTGLGIGAGLGVGVGVGLGVGLGAGAGLGTALGVAGGAVQLIAEIKRGRAKTTLRYFVFTFIPFMLHQRSLLRYARAAGV